MSNDFVKSDPVVTTPRRGKWIKWVVGAVGFVLIALWLDIEMLGHWEVRIDSGDLRRSGLVFSSWPRALPDADRSRLLEASRELAIPAKWCRIVHIAPSNSDIGGRRFLYSGAAFWLGEEPGLGRKILSQIANHFEHPAPESGWPEAARFCFCVEWDFAQKHRRINEDRLERSESLADELKALDYTPRRGGKLERILNKTDPMISTSTKVLVDSATRGEGSKYHWQHARVVQQVESDPRWPIGSTIEFAHIASESDVPEGLHLLYLEHMNGPPPWWRLIKYEPGK